MTSNIGRHGLPSPVPSPRSPATSTASTLGGQPNLPTARKRPLQPGSPKEITLINYLDDKVLRITRRYGMKFVEPDSSNDNAPGYTNMSQVVQDLDPLIDLAWVSGTPTIQIPYLLSFAGTVMSYMSAFEFSTDVFQITKKLDFAFAALLQGTSGPAIQAHPVSTTEKVRMRSLVVETKLTAVYVANLGGLTTETEDSDNDSNDDDGDDMDVDGDNEDLPISLAISRMYKTTIEILGDSLAQ